MGKQENYFSKIDALCEAPVTSPHQQSLLFLLSHGHKLPKVMTLYQRVELNERAERQEETLYRRNPGGG